MFLSMICFVPVESSYLKTLLHLPQHIIPLMSVILWLCSGQTQTQRCGSGAVVIQAVAANSHRVCERYPRHLLRDRLKARGSCFAVCCGYGGIWNGHQQGRYPAGYPLRRPEGDGILLPGNGESRARRAPCSLPRPVGCGRLDL